MSLRHLQMILVLLVLLVVGGIEWNQYRTNRQVLAKEYTIRLKTLMYDTSYLISKEIEEKQHQNPLSLRSILNNINIIHDYIKEAGLLADGTVQYSTEKKSIGKPLPRPPVMLDAFKENMIFDGGDIGIDIEYYRNGEKHFIIFFVKIDPQVLEAHLQETYMRGNYELLAIILLFLALFVSVIHYLVLRPLNRLSASLHEGTGNFETLPAFFLSELEYLKKRFIVAIDNLEEQRNLFHTLFESAPDAIVLFNINTARLALFNRQALALLGYSDETFRTVSIYDITTMTPGEFDRKTEETKKNIFASYEDRFKKRSGALIDVRVIRRYLPMNGEEYCLCIWHDITEEKKEFKQKLLASSVFENTQEAILIMDAEKNIVSANKASLALFGYRAEELIGSVPHLLSSAMHDRDFYKKMYAELAASGQWRGEIVNRTKTGETIPLWAHFTAVSDHGKLVNYLAVYTDMSEIKQARQHLDHISRHDRLTDLINKNTFDIVLEHSLQKAQQQNSQLAVLLIDIDDFKDINDTYGHTVGDEYLVGFAKILREVVKEESDIARVGGDEFIISLDNVDKIAVLLEELYQRFTTPMHLHGSRYYVSLSIGIAIFPQDGKTVDTLVKNADAAMYKAKEAGKNRYTFYRPSMTEAVSEKIELEKKIHRALERGEFTVHYQPQMAIADRRIVGVEALIRWPHPEEGMIPPDRFIPVAEQSNLIHAIGLFVLKQACHDFAKLVERGLNHGSLAVNVSSRQLQLADLKTSLDAILLESKLDPKHLELEVTERLLMQNPEKIAALFNAFRERGITIAIDDFGTGYSSLSYLNELPIDKLKIDKSFVDKMMTDKSSRSICQTVIAIGDALEVKTIAEGVETEAQLTLLGEMGCDEIQGYYLARPMDIGALERFLSERA